MLCWKILEKPVPLLTSILALLFLQITQGSKHIQQNFLLLFSPQQNNESKMSWMERMTELESFSPLSLYLDFFSICKFFLQFYIYIAFIIIALFKVFTVAAWHS